MRQVTKASSVVLVLAMAVSAVVVAQDNVTVSHAFAVRGEPKYGPDFTHFDYVNPNAPKGGTLELATIGTYDNFNRYAQRGVSSAGSSSFNDSLMVGSDDEIAVYYGLIAEKIEYPEDLSWVAFHINPNARHQDGQPITASDVVFSFNKFWEEGVPQFRGSYENVESVEATSRLRVLFTFKEPADREFVSSVANLTILPPQFWESRDLAEPLDEVPLGSGAYTVSDYDMGSYVVLERLDDYWGADLPVNKGRMNFDYTRYDYYRDETVSLEAFKAGEYDFRQESVAKNWATLYTGPNFDAGYIVKEELEHEIPPGMQAFVYNVQREPFMDRRVRRALTYLFDFEWMNKNLFYGQYSRLRSYFQNTEYEHTGTPSRRELEILRPLRDGIPEEVFTEEYNPPVTDGTGNIRPQIRQALALLREAGWSIQDGKMVNSAGEQMQFELMLYSPSFERIAIPYQENLNRIGVQMDIRVVDTAQFTKRWREGDFDMVSDVNSPYIYPSTGLRIAWHSDFIDSSYNTPRVQDPEVDALIEGIVANQDNPDELLAYGRALDRVLMWEHYQIPEWYSNNFRVAYWNKFSRPETRPKYSLGLDTWWVDESKQSRLPEDR